MSKKKREEVLQQAREYGESITVVPPSLKAEIERRLYLNHLYHECYMAARALMSLPPYPWNKRKRKKLKRELASKVSEVTLLLEGFDGSIK